MPPAETPPDPQAGPRAARLPRGSRLGEVHLAVTDRTRALAFWTQVLGLTELPGGATGDRAGAPGVAERDAQTAPGADSASPGAVRLGTSLSGGRALVVLHPGATGPVVPRRTGLYHVALHVTTRRELARVVARLFALRYPNSPTDHLVSETTYLADPDGNGIELTLETPERGSFLSEPVGGMMARTTDGELRSGRDPVDLDSLFAELGPSPDLMAPLASDRVHHVHLHVAHLEGDGAFYRDVVGFPQQTYVPLFQMLDYSLSPDTVVHSLALNSWAGEGAPPRPAGTAGLVRFTLEVPSPADVEALVARLDAAGWPHQAVPGGVEVADPSANRLRVVVGG